MPTSEYGKDTFRGLLIPDERVNEANIDASSTHTQADPQPGVPVPQGPTDLNLEASGTQSASKQLRVATQRGGHPGRGAASFRWKQEADAGTLWRGAWPFSAMSGHRIIRNVTPTTSSGRREAIDPHGVLMDDDKIGVVYDELHYALSTTYYRIGFFTISSDGTVSSDSTLYTRLTGTQRLHPCIVKLPDGRLNIYHYLEDTTNDLVQVQLITSDDNGASWTTVSTGVLDEPIDVSSGSSGYDLNDRPSAKMRVAYSGGQMLMIICARSNDTSTDDFEDGFFQYASSDSGLNFERVEVWDRTINGTQAEVVPSTNGFEVFFNQYATSGSTTQFVRRRSLASAFMPLSSATDLDGPEALQTGNFDPCLGAGRSFTEAEIAACVADDGQLYVIARGKLTAGSFASSACGDLRICVDPSGGSSRGESYVLMGQGTSGDEAGVVGDRGGTIFFAEGGTDYPRYFAMIPAHGRIYLLHNARAGTATDDNAIWMMTLGGYQTTTLGTTDEWGSPQYQVCWDRTWLPIELPNNFSGWSVTTAGTNSADVDSGYLTLTTGAGKHNFFKTPTGTIAEGIIAHFGCQFVSYSLGTELIFARFTQADGSDKYTLDVWIKNGSIAVEDNNGGAALGSLTIDTATNGVEVLVFFRSGKATVYARERTMAADNTWQAVCSNASVSDSGSGSMEVRFGHKAASTASSKWYFFNYVSNDWAGGVPYSTGFTNPDDLTGKMLGSAVSTYITDGTKIRGIDGPTIPGDTWHIDTRYGFGIENALVPTEPSPQKGWRSTNESAQEIVWTFTGPNSYSTLGIYLDGCNWRTGTLHGWNPSGGGSWVALASIDTAAGQTSLAFQRLGDAATVNTSASTTAGRYYELDELVGGTVDLGSSKYRTITANSPGIWTNAAGHVLPALRLSGVDNSEPSSGTLNIWSPRILLVIHDVDLVYTKFKLTVAAQQTATDDLRIGQAVIGSVQLFSQDYSHGRTISSEANTDVATYRDGSRSSIKRGPNRKTVTFGWGEGVDITPLQGSSGLAPDYLLGSSTTGAPVIGYRGDMPSIMSRLLDVTGGSNLPVVYIPAVDKGSAGNDQKTIQGLGPIYGRIVSAVSQDSLIGEEASSTAGEVMRISNIQIEEEL